MRVVNNGTGGFGRKGLSRKVKKDSRWSSVRESYLVVVNEPGEVSDRYRFTENANSIQLTVWDVFMFDPDFRIEQPRRYYRQGINNILNKDSAMVEHPISSSNKLQDLGVSANRQQNLHPPRNGDGHESDNHSLLGSVKSRISRVFHSKAERSQKGFQGSRPKKQVQREENVDSDDSSSIHPRPWTPMLDPSTNPNPLSAPEDAEDQAAGEGKTNEEVSRHTFYIVNSQMKLKLFTRNEVCSS